MTLIRIKLRLGTAAEWASANPILSAGEPGYETDLGGFKIGNGTDHWSDLSYQNVDPASLTALVSDAQQAAADAAQSAIDAANAAASATGATDTGVAALVNDTTPPNATRAALNAIFSALGHTHTAVEVTDLTAAVLAIIDAALLPGTNVTIVDNGNGTWTINSTGGGGGGLTTEQLMDFLGGVTTPGAGILGGGLVSVAYSDTAVGGAGTITITTTATQNSSDGFLLNRANHTGEVPLASMASDWMTAGDPSNAQAGRVPIWDGDSWEHGVIDLSRFPTKDTAGGGLNGTVRQFADIPDTPLAEGEAWVGPPSGTTLDVVQVGGLVDSFDPSSLRLLPTRLPKYRPAIHILDPGEAVPSDTDLPYVVLRKTAAPSLVPILLDSDGVFAQTTNTMVAVSGPAVTPAGTVLCLVIGESGEATLPAEHTMAWASGTCPFTLRQRGSSSGNAQVSIYEGVVTADIPANTNLTLVSKLPDGTTNQNRVHQMASLFALPNVDSTTPFDQGTNGGGGTSSALDKTLTFGSPTPQPDEIIIMALVNNYGTGGVTRPTLAVSPAVDLQSVLSSAASARNLWVGYRILSAIEANAAITGHINASDGATGGWAAASAGFLAA